MAPGSGGLRLYPSNIKFTQDSINAQFMDGRELSSTLEELLYVRKTVDDIPAIEVVEDIEDDDGGWWALTGNRRLYLYRKLEQLGVVETIPVVKLNFWEYGVSERLSERRTTFCNGRDIRLRGGQGEWRINEMIDRWRGSRSFIPMPKKQQPVMNSIQATIIQSPTPPKKESSEQISSVNKSPEEEVPLVQFTSNQCTAAVIKESVAYTIDEENWEEETAEDAALMLLRQRIFYAQMKDNNCHCKCISIVIFICLLFAVVVGVLMLKYFYNVI